MRINPLLPEKQRARYRLAGALILVLAAVIALPKLLHSPSRPDQGGEMEIWVAAPPAASGASSSAASAAPSSASFAKHAPSAEMSAQPNLRPKAILQFRQGYLPASRTRAPSWRVFRKPDFRRIWSGKN